MALLLATVEATNRDLVNRDSIQNNFAFVGADGISTATAVTAAQTALIAFYAHFIQYMSGAIDWNNAVVKYYDITLALGHAPHGSPITTLPLAQSFTPGVANLPHGLCVCVSYHSNPGTTAESGGADASIPTDARARREGAPATHAGIDRPRSRTRGRLYLGPFNQAALSTATSNAVKAAIATALKTAIQAALVELVGRAGTQWGQWSRRNAALMPVTGGHLTDNFAYQRLRAEHPSGPVGFGS
jgi:hypothetical protein